MCGRGYTREPPCRVDGDIVDRHELPRGTDALGVCGGLFANPDERRCIVHADRIWEIADGRPHPGVAVLELGKPRLEGGKRIGTDTHAIEMSRADLRPVERCSSSTTRSHRAPSQGSSEESSTLVPRSASNSARSSSSSSSSPPSVGSLFGRTTTACGSPAKGCRPDIGSV